MKKIILHSILFLIALNISAQSTGDTIIVKAFKYGSNTRDTLIHFPPGNLTYEKIILKYNMRCKNGLVSTSALPNQGCGQWDYSCNTYIVDSTKIENAPSTAPSHIISNFSGTTFNYVSQPIYDIYNYNQTSVNLTSIISENQYTVGTGVVAAPNFLKANERSGKSHVLYTAAELTSAGFTAGNINGILLNVANTGGGVNFFKVGVQHSSLTALNANSVTLTGFTNVYNHSYTFTTGSNRVQFATPFVWDGTSNVLIEFSFTNTVPTNPIVFNGVNTPGVMALYAKNNYALDLSALGHSYLNPSMLSSINNEISVSFWAFGNAAFMPTSTNFLYGYDSNAGHRQFSLQLPWGDNNVYFDCGYTNGGYDRVSKTAAAAEQGGQWNHWAFTKNAVTGNMKIYLNGALWTSGTGDTKPISLLNLILGKDADLLNNYKGKVNELTIWNKELALTDVQAWMNKPIDNTHPYYTNLLAYYKMNEGTGLTLNDTKNSLTSTGVNLQWTYDRGNNLTRLFSETTVRPDVVFLRGTYAVTTATAIVKDSVARNPNVVQTYSITSNASVIPAISDAVTLVSTTNLYQATPKNIYDGDSNTLTSTVAVTPTGVINITNLNYFSRYPFYNEIMSFVTPYGIGLDMGPAGKSWYFDVTDYTPLLKGPKRLLMTLGGENQEQMDLDFMFIVGTPPRDVVEFNQLWQGTNRAGNAPIADINSDARFAPLSVPLVYNAQFYKLRASITGHGSQGEFSQNGGLINHMINLDGGPVEFSWQITTKCSTNPLYPQGGTWLYDRQGWCPGKNTMLKELDLTPLVIPSSTVTIDYNCSTPPVPSGDYRYHATHQLISYGAPNHVLDAAIEDVLAPSNKILYGRTNPICASPAIMVRNTGATALTALEIEYWINSTTTKQTYTWTGNLASLDTTRIYLPVNTLWQSGIQTTNNKFNVKLKTANSVVDDYSFNNSYSSPFVIPGVVPGNFSVVFKTNNTLQNAYTIFDDNGNVVGSSNFTAANTVYTDNYTLNGCYTFSVSDAGNDGLQWFANTAQGSGYIQITDVSSNIIKTFQPDFGSGFVYNFTTDVALSVHENKLDASMNLYPNPSHNKFTLQGSELDGAQITVTNLLGQTLNIPVVKKNDTMEFNTTALMPGVYFISIAKDGNSATKKVIVN